MSKIQKKLIALKGVIYALKVASEQNDNKLGLKLSDKLEKQIFKLEKTLYEKN